MHKQETTFKVRKDHLPWGTLLISALFLGAIIWLTSNQVAMTDTVSPEAVLSDAGSSEPEQEVRDVDPPDPDDREVDPPDPDRTDREVDPPDPDLSRGEVDPPDPDIVP